MCSVKNCRQNKQKIFIIRYIDKNMTTKLECFDTMPDINKFHEVLSITETELITNNIKQNEICKRRHRKN